MSRFAKETVALAALIGVMAGVVWLMAFADKGQIAKAGFQDKKPSDFDKVAIAKFITTYLITSFAERGKFVSDPKTFEKVQQKYYENWRQPKDVKVTVITAEAGPRSNCLVVKTNVKSIADETNTATYDYYLVKIENGLKVDWAAMAGYNQLNFKAWAAGTDDTVALRVTARLEDHYNYQYFACKETHYAFALEERFGGYSSRFYGYVSKTSDVGKRLFEVTKNGQKHELIVTIQRTARETNAVGIVDLVNGSWFW